MGNQTQRILYAPYIEERHENLLITTANIRKAIVNDRPDFLYEEQETNNAFLGIGYAISDFAALYAMFGKYMSGFNIEVLWDRVFNQQMQSPEITGTIKASLDIKNDTILNAESKYSLDMRSINSVASSSYVIGKAKIEQNRIKQLATISAELKFKLLEDNSKGFNAVLNWNKNCIQSYGKLMQVYYLTTSAGDERNDHFNIADKLWPFTVLKYERKALGTMQPPILPRIKHKRSRSTLSKYLLIASYTWQGAYLGSSFGPWGTVIGAVIGFVIGVAIVMNE